MTKRIVKILSLAGSYAILLNFQLLFNKQTANVNDQ